jgi:hypothetical protein
MSGNQSDDCRRVLTILDNVLTVGGQLGVNSELTGLNINLEASQKELEGVRKIAWRRTLARRSGGSMSTAKNTSTSPGSKLKKQLKINMALSLTVLFLLFFSVN